MISDYKIISLKTDRWQEYKAIRLEALKTEPQAFGSSYGKEKYYTDLEWQNRLSSPDRANIKLFIEKKDHEIIGMAGSFRAPENSNIAYVISVYITPKERGKGFAKIILKELLEKLASVSDISIIELQVNIKQAAAIKTYLSCGFNIIEKIKFPSGKVEYLMRTLNKRRNNE